MTVTVTLSLSRVTVVEGDKIMVHPWRECLARVIMAGSRGRVARQFRERLQTSIKLEFSGLSSFSHNSLISHPFLSIQLAFFSIFRALQDYINGFQVFGG